MTIKFKMIAICIISIMILSLCLTFFAIKETDKIILQKEIQNLESLEKVVDSKINDIIKDTEVSVLSIAKNKEVIDAFEARDRQKLLTMLMPVFDSIKGDISQVQFHLPNSTSFLRLHMPNKFGDSLKTFRFTVNDANKTKKTMKGIENGVGGLGIRVVVPMEKNGIHLGTVEYGSEFGNVFLTGLKNMYSAEYFIYRLNDEKDEVLASTTEKDSWIVENKYIKDIKNGKSAIVNSDNNKYSMILIPYRDYSNKIIGYIKAITDRTEVMKQMDGIRNAMYLFVFISIIIMMCITFILISFILKPLGYVISAAESFSKGDLTKTVKITLKDEIGQLNMKFNNMADNLRNIIGNVRVTINEVDKDSKSVFLLTKDIGNASEEISKTIQSIAEGSSKQASEAMISLNNANMLSDKLEETVKYSKDMILNTAIMDDKANKGIVSINVLKNKFSENTKSTREVSDNVFKLTEKSRNIANIVSTINSLTEQTNLLSLNAAIEAARAGEQGRGFAVVADEVRKLSSQSADATNTIQNIISEITYIIEATNKSMVDTNTIMNDAQGSMYDVESILKEIILSIQDVVERVNKSAQFLNQVEEIKDNVVTSVSKISNVTENAAASTQEISASSEEQATAVLDVIESMNNLNKKIIKLNEFISIFKI
ncbi:MAG TPA: hypothetical protein DEP72_00230 [Clostridiales bacterium]|nr:hypothetical protein [Clostridiales bacterium]